jgi:hypothetical protein
MERYTSSDRAASWRSHSCLPCRDSSRHLVVRKVHPAPSLSVVAEVIRQAKQAMPWGNSLLDIALDLLALGRALPPGSAEATHHLDEALTGLRKAGALDHLPLGLLARAANFRHLRDFPAPNTTSTKSASSPPAAACGSISPTTIWRRHASSLLNRSLRKPAPTTKPPPSSSKKPATTAATPN